MMHNLKRGSKILFLFQIAYLYDHTKDFCSKVGRELLSAIAQVHPITISFLLQKLRDVRGNIGAVSYFHLFFVSFFFFFFIYGFLFYFSSRFCMFLMSVHSRNVCFSCFFKNYDHEFYH